METSLERLDSYTVRLTVKIPPDEVDAAIDEAYKRVANRVKVPGFRAGKAPKPVIDTHLGKDAVLADAQDDLLTESYSSALDNEGIRPIQQPEIGELDLVQPGTAFEYEAEILIRPELELSSLDDLKVEVPPAEATEEEVDAQIDHTREKYASLEPVEDRGVQADDYVLLSFEGLVDGEEYEGNKVDKYLYEMNRGLMPEEFEAALIGVEAGGKAKAEFDIPDTSTNEEFVGKTATFDVEVHEIKAKVLPEVDEEFAMNAGGYDSVEDMRTDIKAQIDRSKAMGRAQEHEMGVRKALAERLEGDVPDQMIENAREQIKRDFVNGLESRGTNIEEYLAQTGMGIEQIDSMIEKQAEDSVREDLALEALFRQIQGEITDEDLDKHVSEMASAADSDPAELRKKWEEAGVMSVLHEQIMQSKAIAWLMDESNVEVVEKTTVDSDEDDDDTDGAGDGEEG